MSAHEYFPKDADISGYFRYLNAVADEITTATPRCYARIRDASRSAGMPPCSFTNGLSMYNDGRYSSKNPGWHENDGISDLNRSWTSAAEPAACWR